LGVIAGAMSHYAVCGIFFRKPKNRIARTTVFESTHLLKILTFKEKFST
jgi:hypothetical protein